ncbi:hypothetical protein CTI12_AA618690 [Artemisia annua]|uniref:Uncharacterized protein n=1 Tax=Artemisia annua TaxID=35608 RepID=A0A2U1K9J1_ARTAN|nr:hypothetical protein CTI12_AA618690 [Artemisia annua]
MLAYMPESSIPDVTMMRRRTHKRRAILLIEIPSDLTDARARRHPSFRDFLESGLTPTLQGRLTSAPIGQGADTLPHTVFKINRPPLSVTVDEEKETGIQGLEKKISDDVEMV